MPLQCSAQAARWFCVPEAVRAQTRPSRARAASPSAVRHTPCRCCACRASWRATRRTTTSTWSRPRTSARYAPAAGLRAGLVRSLVFAQCVGSLVSTAGAVGRGAASTDRPACQQHRLPAPLTPPALLAQCRRVYCVDVVKVQPYQHARTTAYVAAGDRKRLSGRAVSRLGAC